jgi:hypothetical protein
MLPWRARCIWKRYQILVVRIRTFHISDCKLHTTHTSHHCWWNESYSIFSWITVPTVSSWCSSFTMKGRGNWDLLTAMVWLCQSTWWLKTSSAIPPPPVFSWTQAFIFCVQSLPINIKMGSYSWYHGERQVLQRLRSCRLCWPIHLQNILSRALVGESWSRGVSLSWCEDCIWCNDMYMMQWYIWKLLQFSLNGLVKHPNLDIMFHWRKQGVVDSWTLLSCCERALTVSMDL